MDEITLNEHLEYMQISIDEAKKSKSEDNRVHPKVGAIAVKDGKILATAYRGELGDGEHAEFTLLDGKLKDSTLSGSTIYTTLEPCISRSSGKIPCAQRLIDRKVSKVVIGILDPNEEISGRGQRLLREARITTEFYNPPEFMSQIEELNREFILAQKNTSEAAIADEGFVERNKDRSLDDWYKAINRIYWKRNLQTESLAMLAHLVEVIGSVSSLASEKKKQGIDSEIYIAKSVVWWMSICGRLGVKSVEDMIWDKYPKVCPYCLNKRHDEDDCRDRRKASPGTDWTALGNLGESYERPERLADWQRMFSAIFPAQQTDTYGTSFARLSEELGELAEAMRVFPLEPGYFLGEAADVFAWLMHIQNIYETKNNIQKSERGMALGRIMSRFYPDSCKNCGNSVCTCSVILESTIGRIAHEVPPSRAEFNGDGRFLSPDRIKVLFRHQ